jgi:predicted phage baseplate assembly protein
MSTEIISNVRDSSSCDCCEGIAVQTPVEVSNRPSLSAIAYRVGIHPQFKATMIARLSSDANTQLRGLTTRDGDDFSLALLDAWATVSDVLTFYQERIANESYLRTADERVSILELSRLIGYELRPGVAASTYLAFTLNEAPGVPREMAEAMGAPAKTKLDVGIKVQSTPLPDEKAQTFETVEGIEARVEWNAIRPRLTKPQLIVASADVVYLAGLATNLKKGDGLLITPLGQDASFRQVAEVTTEDAKGRTRVRLQQFVDYLGMAIPNNATATAALSPTAQKYLGQTLSGADLHVAALTENFSVTDLFNNLVASRPPQYGVMALRQRASIFGHNAPRWETLPLTQRTGEIAPNPDDPSQNYYFKGPYNGRKFDWAETSSLSTYPGTGPYEQHVYLDNLYPSIVKNSWLVLKDGNHANAYEAAGVSEISKSDFTVSAKVTLLTLNSRSNFYLYGVRSTTVFAQSESLETARVQVDAPIEGAQVELDTFVDGLFAGQNIIISGELSTAKGVNASELATIGKVEHVLKTEGFTRLTLSAPLDHSYARESVKINANVALATHGETVKETLGSGDAGKTYQRFALRQPPLTFTSATTPTGTQSTLEVRVNNLLWHEVPTLYAHTSEERIYITRTDDDGRTFVQFGDGQAGARLPTGQDNVTATYRKGIGLAGLLKPNQLSQLMTRPLGLKEATNPLATAGASNPESRDSARRNATLTLHTLERIVSLTDYEDYARAFAGVAKTLATWTWSGERRGVFVTIAGPEGAAIEDNSPLRQNLLAAMRAAGDPAVALQVQTFEPRFFRLKAKIKVREDYIAEDVVKQVKRRLRHHFAFDARAFGQIVTLSEVIAIMQRTAGVVAVDVDQLYRTDAAPALNPRLPAAQPLAGTEKVYAAELLTLDLSPLQIEVMP